MTTEMRFFRVGEGRTFHLPAGLVEGNGARIACPGLAFRRWDAEKPRQRKIERGVHPSVVALEVQRITGELGGQPYERFVNKALLNGDLKEIAEAEYQQALDPTPARGTKSSSPIALPAPATKESAS